MALEDVIEEVLSQAEREKKTIVDSAKREAEAIVNGARKRAEDKAKQFRNETQGLIEEARKTNESDTNLKINKAMLASRKEVIDGVFSKLIECINSMTLKEREKSIVALMKKASGSMDASFVYCNSKDKQFVTGFKDLKFGGSIDTMGGIVVENSARDVRENYTFDILIEKLKEAYTNEIAKKIF